MTDDTQVEASRGENLARPHVMLLTPWYPSPAKPMGGIFVREFARLAAAAGTVTVVHVVARDDGRWRRSITVDDDAGVSLIRVAVRTLPGPMGSLQFVLAGVVGGRHADKRFGRPDVVHVHVITQAVAGLVLARWWHRPLIVTEHSSVFLPASPASLGAFWKFIARICLRRADAVLPVSAHLADAMRPLAPNARIRVVPNVVDAVFRFRPEIQQVPGRLVAAGTLVADKAHADILRAVRRLVDAGHDVSLVLVGDGPDRVSLERLADDLDLADRVELPGTIDKADLAALVATAQAFVLSSRYETFSVVVAEALASGVPVVVTRCGGPEEFVDASNGVVVDVGDPQALADGIAEVLTDRGHFDRGRISASAYARFGSDAVARGLFDVYAEVGACRS